jgi:hypothetical protein
MKMTEEEEGDDEKIGVDEDDKDEEGIFDDDDDGERSKSILS